MPVKSCKLPDGSNGYKWGDDTRIYRSKQEAIKQGISMELSKKKRGLDSEFDKSSIFYKELMYNIATELSFSEQLFVNRELTSDKVGI